MISFTILLNSFVYGLADHNFTLPPTWASCLATLIPKTSAPSAFTDFREIVKLACCLKVVYKLCTIDMETHMRPLPDYLFGGRKGLRCGHMQLFINHLIISSNRWGPAICVAKVDLRRAFASLPKTLILEALIFAGVPPWLRSLLLFLLDHLNVNPTMRGSSAGWVHFENGVREGGPHSMLILNVVMAFLLSQLIPKWEAAGHGFRAKNACKSYFVVFWVDDGFFFSSTPWGLQSMYHDFVALLTFYKGAVSPKKTSWITNAY